MSRRLVVGDPHGELDKLTRVLQDARLVDGDSRWCAGDDQLWILGDYTDRGPDGVGVVELVMRLQQEADKAGGRVGTVLGNHDGMIVAAQRFPTRSSSGPGGTFLLDWAANGGQHTDLERLTMTQADWLVSQPAMALVGDALLVHADALFYLRYGNTIDEVNQRFRAVLDGHDTAAWDRLLGQFGDRMELRRPSVAERFLRTFGGRLIVHGHTPIPIVTREQPERVVGPLVYADGLCVNVDGAMFAGGPGFVFDLDAGGAEPQAGRVRR